MRITNPHNIYPLDIMLRSAYILIFVITITSILSTTNAQGRGYSGTKLVYPQVHQVNKTWSFKSAKANGNVTYNDPFYWLEGKLDDPEIKTFITDQTNLTDTYMKGCKNQDAIIDSLTQASTYDDYQNVLLVTPSTGDKPFYFYSLVLAGDQPNLWYTASVEEFQNAKKNNFNIPPGKLFFDESKLSTDGNSRIATNTISPDGKVFAYLVTNPSTEGKWFFRNFDSPLVNPKTFPEGGEGRFIDVLTPSGDSISWMPDSKSLFYTQHQDSQSGTNTVHGYQIRYHVLGNNNPNDITIFDSNNASEHGLESGYFIVLSPDGKWLIVTGYYDTSNFGMVSYATMLTNQTISDNMKWISLAPDYDFAMYSGGVVDDEYYFQTDKDAPNQKVAKFKLDWSKARQVKQFTELQDRPKMIDVVPERNDAIIASYGIYPTAIDKLIVFYIEEGVYTTYVYNIKTGKFIQKLLPGEGGTIHDSNGDQNSNTFIISLSTYNSPKKVFELYWNGNFFETSSVTVRSVKGSNPDDFEVKQLYATSKDGIQIPYLIACRKGNPKNPSSPLWLQAYGAYGYVDTLDYHPNYFDYLRSYDGCFVYAGVRGGGDKGGHWHDVAYGVNKQKTFDDIIAVAQDTVKRGFTSPGNIIIEGLSAGGAAIAAVTNQAPEGLIGVSFPIRAPCDIFQVELRTTNGYNNRAEYGDVTTPEGYDAVRAWSPLQNVNTTKQYPAVLVSAGSADKNVLAASSFKFVAQLQLDHPNNSMPLLLYLAQNKGHVSPDIVESSYQMCFLEEALGIKRRNN